MIAINNDEDPDYSDDDDNKILMDVRRLQIFREGRAYDGQMMQFKWLTLAP